MTNEQIKELIEAAGYEVQSYSGRGMMSKECLGFTTDDDPFEVAANFIDVAENPGNDLAFIRDIDSDSMGKSTIYYLPRVAWTE